MMTPRAWGGSPAAPVDFDRDIRPLLSDRCFVCHGPDADSRQADLRLDTYAGLNDAAVVVPGQPDDSELIVRITSDDAEQRMPPPDSKLSLSSEEQELLRRWVAEGAIYSQHWAFTELPATIDVPAVVKSDWARQTLDRFVLARLEAEQLAPSPRASALRLLRRMTLDLTGLPPTAQEIHDFEAAAADDFDRATEQLVERLLESPAFGEHLAVAWLDAARYADSFGYQSDQLNTQWPYRDWVVRALNRNMPYDVFITNQLAGDLVANRSRDTILATAFNRMNRLTNEGGSIAEEWLVENAADRLHTFGTAMLGLTLECARCHDHKYDPISQRDYYSMLAFFNSIDENGMYDHTAKVPSPTLMLPTDEQAAALDAARRRVAEAEAALAESKATGEGRFQEWLASTAESQIDDDKASDPEGADASNDRSKAETGPSARTLTSPDLTAYFSFDDQGDAVKNQAPGATGEVEASGVGRVAGASGQAVRFDGDRGLALPNVMKIDRADEFTMDFWIRDTASNPLPVVVAQRTFGTDVGYNGFDVLLTGGVLDIRLFRVWPGNGIGVRSREKIEAGEWQHVAITYDGSSRAAGFHLYLNGREVPTTVLRDRIQKSAAIATYGAGHFTLGQRFRDRGFQGGEIDELRVFDRALAACEIAKLHDNGVSEAGGHEAEPSRESLREYYFSAVDGAARELAQKLREARRALVAAEELIHEVAVMEELPQPRATHILARGAYDAPRTAENRVERNTFADMLLPFPSDAPRDRLGLAQWLTDPRHPLTARVFVNHLWANFFGRGLVATPENFGRQGERPTHPKLLDWLSRDFVDHQWNIKRLCRQIVLSATYQQDSKLRPELAERDPENLLMARGPSRRLSAEQIRDLALAASGLLEREVGGPPVAPYQPGQDLWREANQMSPAYQQSTGPGLYRRSLYSVWKRTAPLPNMTAFDAASREVCVVARSRTNTPLQALVLLNDVQFVEASRALAEEVAHAHGEESDQIAEAFLRLTGRPPDETEQQLLSDMMLEQRASFAREPDQARIYLEAGDSKLSTDLEADATAIELAALAATCQAIMNLDATIYER